MRAKALELYQHEYAVAYPLEERPAGRPARTTPLYATLAAKGAGFGARGGWERALWFGAGGGDRSSPSAAATGTRRSAEECRAVRERVAVLDLGGFTKLEVGGKDAAGFLDRLICGRLPKVGRVALAYMCQPDGGLLCELTIARLAEQRFYLCSAAAAEWHDQHWLLAQRRPDEDVAIENVSARYGTLVLAGPRSREVLGRLTDADLSNAAFPWLAARPIEIGAARLLALRINYVGELGWELHVPLEHELAVYEALMTAGADLGIRDFGMYAMDSLRLEKGYPAWKVDLSHEYTPLEAALERFVDLEKADFVGRDALLRQRAAGVPQRLVPLAGRERRRGAVLRERLSAARSGSASSARRATAIRCSRASRSPTCGASSPSPAARSRSASSASAAAATVGQAPLYDPQNLRLRA